MALCGRWQQHRGMCWINCDTLASGGRPSQEKGNIVSHSEINHVLLQHISEAVAWHVSLDVPLHHHLYMYYYAYFLIKTISYLRSLKQISDSLSKDKKLSCNSDWISLLSNEIIEMFDSCHAVIQVKQKTSATNYKYGQGLVVIQQIIFLHRIVKKKRLSKGFELLRSGKPLPLRTQVSSCNMVLYIRFCRAMSGIATWVHLLILRFGTKQLAG